MVLTELLHGKTKVEKQRCQENKGASHQIREVSQIHGSARRTTDPAAADRTLAWTFDNGGRLIQASDPAATYNYTLDNPDRVTVETQNSSGIGLVPTVRMTRGYDLVGNRTGLAAEFQTGAAVTKDFTNSYTLDELDRNSRSPHSTITPG